MRSLPFALFTRLIPVALVAAGDPADGLRAITSAGVAVQVVLALAAGAGAGAGSERGAFAGFALGMMYDLGVGTPLGLTALAYGLAGLTSGYVMSITPDPQWWLAAVFVAIGSAVGRGGHPGREVPDRPGGLADRSPVPGAAGGHHCGDRAQPVDGAARPMVRRGQAPHVEGDPRMIIGRTNRARSFAPARRQQWCHGDR